MTVTKTLRNGVVRNRAVDELTPPDFNDFIKIVDSIDDLVGGTDVVIGVYGYSFRIRSRSEALQFVMGFQLARELLTDFYKLEENT